MDIFTLGGHRKLMGSYFDHILWPSDIDLVETVNTDAEDPDAFFMRDVQQLIRQLRKTRLCRITNIRYGTNWTIKDFLRTRDVVPLDKFTKVKIDIVIWIPEEGRFREISNIFVFRKNGRRLNYMPGDTAAALVEDMQEQISDGNFWKALKRRYSIAGLQHDNATKEFLREFFNSGLGALSSVISEIDALALLVQSGDIPVAHVQTQIDGIQLRLGRIMSFPRQEFDEIQSLASDRTVEARDRIVKILRKISTHMKKILDQEAAKILRMMGL